MTTYAGKSNLKGVTKKQLLEDLEWECERRVELREELELLKERHTLLQNFVKYCGSGAPFFHYIDGYGGLYRNGRGGMTSDILKEERRLKRLLGIDKRGHILIWTVILSVSFSLLGIFCQLLADLSRG